MANGKSPEKTQPVVYSRFSRVIKSHTIYIYIFIKSQWSIVNGRWSMIDRQYFSELFLHNFYKIKILQEEKEKRKCTTTNKTNGRKTNRKTKNK